MTTYLHFAQLAIASKTQYKDDTFDLLHVIFSTSVMNNTDVNKWEINNSRATSLQEISYM